MASKGLGIRQQALAKTLLHLAFHQMLVRESFLAPMRREIPFPEPHEGGTEKGFSVQRSSVKSV